MQNWDRYLDGYLEEFSRRGLQPEHVENVARELHRWGGWMKQRRPRPKLEEVKADLIVAYLRSRGRFKAKSTISGIMSVLRGMGDWLVRQECWDSNPLRWMQGPKLNPFGRSPRPLSHNDMQALWKAAVQTRQTFYRFQWLALLAVLYGTGYRRGEVVRMNLSDWDVEEGILKCDGRKTGWERQVPSAELVARCVESYLPHRVNHLHRLRVFEETALFVNREGERMKPEAVSRAIHRLAERAGVSLSTLHQFRHSCATDLLEAGVRLPEVQKILGHRVISTTLRYTHISDPKRREAIERHPLNDWL